MSLSPSVMLLGCKKEKAELRYQLALLETKPTISWKNMPAPNSQHRPTTPRGVSPGQAAAGTSS